MYNIVCNTTGRILHTSSDIKLIEHWAFILRNTQGRSVTIQPL